MGFQYCRELTPEELRARSAKLKAEGKSEWAYKINCSGLRMPPEQDSLILGQRYIKVKRIGAADPPWFRTFQQGLYEITAVLTGELDESGKQGRSRLWMSDTPQEMTMMQNDTWNLLNVKSRAATDTSDPSQWHVLVLGLGLGILPQLIEERVAHITVVEVDPLVVKAVWEHVKGPNWDLVLADAWTVDKVFRPGSFDACYMDIWSDVCTDNKEEYVRLKRLARKVGSRRTVGWVEDHVYGRAEFF